MQSKEKQPDYGLVSIITACYNGEKYLSETIDSVLAQTYTNWELLVIDDGSTDSSAQITQSYLQKDSRIRLLQQKNKGASSARNTGIKAATGRYIALLDADDLWKPTFLESQLSFMKEKQTLCVYSSYDRIDENSKQCLPPIICKKSITYKNMLVRDYIGCLTGLYDTSVHGKIYLHEELKSVRDDYAYWLDVLKVSKTAFGNKEILASYRVRTNSVTGKKRRLIKIQYNFYRNYLKLSPLKSFFHTLVWGAAGFYNFFVMRLLFRTKK